ncbi:hypothetical protein ACUXV3_00370 [Roseobacteraceae bacterium NS-SX3]
MKPEFALSFSSGGVALLYRALDGWRTVGHAALGAGDLTAAMAELREKGERLAPAPLACKLIIPNEQIRYLQLETGEAGTAARQEIARGALEGATPYPVDELAFDFCADGPRTHVAALALETLDEAETFAVEHGFLPASFVAVPDGIPFAGEPFFGTARAIRGTEVEPDAEPVTVTGPADIPDPRQPAADAAPAPDAPEDEKPEPKAAADDAAAEAPEAAAQDSADPPAPGEPAAEAAEEAPAETPAPKAEEPPAAEEKPAARPAPAAPQPAALPPAPPAGFSSRRRKPGQSAPAPGGASKAAPAVSAPAPLAAQPPAASAGKAPAARAPKDADKAAPAVKAPPAAPLAGRQTPAAIPPAPAALKTESPVLPKPQAPVPPAAPQPRAKLRHPGLIAAALLLLALAAAGAWTLLPGEDAAATDQEPPALAAVPPEAGPEETAAEQPISPQVSAIPDAPDPGVVELGAAEAEDPASVPPAGEEGAEQPLGDQAAADPEAVEDGLEQESAAEEDELALAAQYAATGIWQTAPEIAGLPGMIDLDGVYVASIDHTSLSQDAVALLPAPGFDTDAVPGAVASPAGPGRAFDLDARGLVKATPEGTLNPDGITVYKGRPAKVPPPTPGRPDPAAEEAAAEEARRAVLSRKRPKLRPDDLAEQAERAQLGGLSRAELAGLRPRLRPASLKTEEAESQPATSRAVATSVPPRARPANFANLVDRAQRNRQVAAASAAAAAAAAVPAPATVQPRIPSSASVARQATLDNAINLRRLNLIGVYGTASDRRALVRLPSGRYQKVKVGDRIDGGRVIAIGESQLQYQKGSRNHTLKIPNG